MDPDSGKVLNRLLREQRVASLGTLYEGEPLVSLVLFSASEDFSSIDLHVSHLAQHTRGLLEDGRVGLMIAEADRASLNPQALPRLSLQGTARRLDEADEAYARARARYLAKFPTASLNFQLGGFHLVRIETRSARLISGFGRIFDLTTEDFARLAEAAG